MKKFTIYGYILTGLAITIIIGLFWNFKHHKKIETISSITQKFDDTLYSLSKQLIAHNLSYDKQTNKIKLRHVETRDLYPHFTWGVSPNKSKTVSLMGQLSLYNPSAYPLINIKGKIFVFRMMGNQFNHTYKGLNLFSSFGLAPGHMSGPIPVVFIATMDSANNMFYTKVEYEDEDGFLRTPIRQIYVIRNASGEPIQPRLIFNVDSFNLVKTYLKQNNIW